MAKKRILCKYPMSEFYTYEDEVPKGTRVSTPQDCCDCSGFADCDGENTCDESPFCLIEDLKRTKIMNHRREIVKGKELMNLWVSDNKTPAEVAGLTEIDPSKDYEVTWPDHVLTPRLNGDCQIREIDDEPRD